ncbi:hypothetical protein ACHAWX_001632 [Stephanocyclus meneghinianus]
MSVTENKNAGISYDFDAKIATKEYSAPSHQDAESRATDIRKYHHLLEVANVAVPSPLVVNVKDSNIVVQSPWIQPMKTNRENYHNCFHQIANGDSQLQDAITLSAFEETLKIIRTEKGTQPIGYDISPQNYILQHNENDRDQKIYLVDFYPPRIAIMSNDGKSILLDECLVDYPETKEPAEGKRKERLQECYYTSAGMLRQFTHWFVATRYAKNKKSVGGIIKECKPLLNEMMDRLQNEEDKSLRDKLHEYVHGTCFMQDLKDRLPKVRQLWKQTMTPSTLVVAAAGKGTRALNKLGKNKLAFEVEKKPLVWHVVDAIREDILINNVLFVVVDDDVKNAINSYAKEIKDLTLNYTFVGEGTRKGVGYAFYEGMRSMEEKGSVVLTVGDTVVYNAAGLFDTDHPVKVGVCSKNVSVQNLGKERTTTGQDSKEWIGVYYFDNDARVQAISEFDAAIMNGDGIMKEKEYRFSWLIKALEGKGVRYGLGDVGAVAEINFSENLTQIEEMVQLRMEKAAGHVYVPQ